MGCTSSKESAPHKSKRATTYGSDTNMPNERYLSDAPRTQAAPDRVVDIDKRGSEEAARPKETFDSYARRGVIRESALRPGDVQPVGTFNRRGMTIFRKGRGSEDMRSMPRSDGSAR